MLIFGISKQEKVAKQKIVRRFKNISQFERASLNTEDCRWDTKTSKKCLHFSKRFQTVPSKCIF